MYLCIDTSKAKTVFYSATNDIFSSGHPPLTGTSLIEANILLTIEL